LESLVRENVRLREQELERCRAIIAERTAALLAKLKPAALRPENPGLAAPPGWTLETATACHG